MSDRTSFRSRGHGGSGGGGGGGPRGGGHRGGRGGSGGGGGSGAGHHQSGSGPERPKKENILNLDKYMDKEIMVKFNGGREVTGILKGHDQLTNLVLDNARETLHADDGNTSTRQLGLLVARGTLLVMISPVDGSEEITNPFAMPDDEG